MSVVGWGIWALLTAAGLLACAHAALALFPSEGRAHRALVALVLWLSQTLVAIQLVGLVDLLSPLPLAFVDALLIAGTTALAHRFVPWRSLRERARAELAWPGRPAWSEAGWLALSLGGVALFGIVLFMVWLLPTWPWDPLWYHAPITSMTIQEHSLRWIDSPNHFLVGYPRNEELVAVWNCVFPRDSRLDDSGQLPFVLLGALVIFAWVRKLGGSRLVASGLAAAWFAVPPVVLQSHSNENDLTCGALLAATCYLLGNAGLRLGRWLALCTLGIYVGTKYSGAFHAALLGPWFAVMALVELCRAKGARAKRALEIAASVLVLPLLGGFKYIQNAVHTGNPFWPLAAKIPILGTQLAGPEDARRIAFTGVTDWFFGYAGDFQKMLDSWLVTTSTIDYEPNVKAGGFGPLFLIVMLPCLILAAVELARGRRWRALGPVVALAALSLVVPSPWWPRYLLGLPIAGAVALGAVVADVQRPFVRFLWGAGCAAIAWVGVQPALYGNGLFKHAAFGLEALKSGGPTSYELQPSDQNWPTELAHKRDTELREGDVFAYDGGEYFLQNLFARDYRARVVALPEDRSLVDALRALHPRWVSIDKNWPQRQAAVRSLGGRELAEFDTSTYWEMPP